MDGSGPAKPQPTEGLCASVHDGMNRRVGEEGARRTGDEALAGGEVGDELAHIVAGHRQSPGLPACFQQLQQHPQHLRPSVLALLMVATQDVQHCVRRVSYKLVWALPEGAEAPLRAPMWAVVSRQARGKQPPCSSLAAERAHTAHKRLLGGRILCVSCPHLEVLLLELADVLPPELLLFGRGKPESVHISPQQLRVKNRILVCQAACLLPCAMRSWRAAGSESDVAEAPWQHGHRCCAAAAAERQRG